MAASRTFFVGGNYKMNGTLESTKKLLQLLKDAQLDSNTGACAAAAPSDSC
jgi:triosephosphate isomerase